jgi:hypothetical protein
MKLFEIFEPTYVVKKVGAGEWDVTKFGDKKEPEAQRHVEVRRNGYWTDSPGFIHRGQEEKNIKIVKQFLKDGEPQMTAYMVDDKTGKVTSKRFG